MATASNTAEDLLKDETEQFEGISEAIVAMAQLRFDQEAPVQGDGGVLDGVAVGLNLLGEELGARVRDRERVDAVMNSIHDAVLVIADKGSITYSNAAAKELLGLDPEETDERLNSYLVLPESAREAGEELLPIGSDAKPSIRRLLRRPGSNPTPIILSTAPLMGVGKTTEKGHVCVLSSQGLGKEEQRWLAGTSETRVPFSVANLVNEVIAFHQNSAESLGLTLELGKGNHPPPWVLGARSPLQSVLHSLMDAALQWTRSGKIQLTVTSVEAPATSRVVLRFRIDNSEGQVDDSLRRRMFEDGDEDSDDSELYSGVESLNMKTAAIVAESLGGKLGLQRGQAGEFVARFWVELTTVTN